MNACAWIYLIGYGDGSVKVGLTCNTARRFAQHLASAKHETLWRHIFPPVCIGVSKRLEGQAIAGLSAVAGSPIRGREVFRDVSRQLAIDTVRQALSEAREEAEPDAGHSGIDIEAARRRLAKAHVPDVAKLTGIPLRTLYRFAAAEPGQSVPTLATAVKLEKWARK
jgi:hypothetical protein